MSSSDIRNTDCKNVLYERFSELYTITTKPV